MGTVPVPVGSTATARLTGAAFLGTPKGTFFHRYLVQHELPVRSGPDSDVTRTLSPYKLARFPAAPHLVGWVTGLDPWQLHERLLRCSGPSNNLGSTAAPAQSQYC